MKEKFVNFIRTINIFSRKLAEPEEDLTHSGILGSVLIRRAVKVQSIVRMHQARQRYKAKRVALGLRVGHAARLDIKKELLPRTKPPKGTTARPRQERVQSNLRPGSHLSPIPTVHVEEKLMPLNPLHMLKGIRKILKSRRLKAEVDAATRIQSFARYECANCM